MRTPRLFVVALALLLLTFSQTHARPAAGLYGRVVEVNSGDMLTVQINTGRLKVRLKGIDAPERDQRWGETAEKHLADLALGRDVKVDSTGLTHDAIVIGYVFLNESDLGLQMIRDGAAWFDQQDGQNTTPEKRSLYEECEKAARNERRGIWQDERPSPPWEWREARDREAKANTQPVLETALKPRKQTGERSLRNESLRASNLDWWQHFAPSGYDFSAMLPVAPSKPIEIDGTKTFLLFADNVVYIITLIPVKKGFVAENAMDELASGYRNGVEQAAKRGGSQSDMTFQRELPPMNGYQGRQYQVVLHGVPGITRFYISTRYVYAVGVFGGQEGDPRIDKFLSSFTINKKSND